MPTAENKYGIYNFVGIRHLPESWEATKDELLIELSSTDFIVSEGFQFKSKSLDRHLRLRQKEKEVAKIQSPLFEKVGIVYVVDVKSKNILVDHIPYAEGILRVDKSFKVRQFFHTSLDYRDVITAAKTTLLAKKNSEILGYKPHAILTYGPMHQEGIILYLSNLEILKRRLKSYEYHPFSVLFDSEIVIEADFVNGTRLDTRIDLSQVYGL